MDYFLVSERLQFRKIQLEDASFIFKLLNTPGWHRFIGDRGITSEEKAKDYIEKRYLSSYAEHGFGNYVVELKESGQAIGTCGIFKRPNLDHPDIGYALLPEFEKRGYALEASRKLLNYAALKWNLQEIGGITAKDNIASISLLKKLGLQNAGTIVMEKEGEELSLFRLHLNS